MLALSLLIPILATFVATINFVLIVINLRKKPWRFKFWLFVGTGMWVSWAGFAVLFRIVPTYELARIILVASFASSYIALYGLYRFHILLTQRETRRDPVHMLLLIITGLNISFSYNETFYIPILNDEGYWVDEFSMIFFLLHFLYTLVIGGYIFKALRELDSFSVFYKSDAKYNYSLLVLGALILFIVVFLILFRSLQATQEGGAPFLLLSMVITSYFGIIYGIYPLSKVLVPQKIWSFMIINEAGLPIYDTNFSDERIGDNMLISSALYASMLLIADKLEGQLINQIELKDRVIIAKIYAGYVFVLIAEYYSLQLELTLDELLSSITADQRFSLHVRDYVQLDEEFIDSHVENTIGGTSITDRGRE